MRISLRERREASALFWRRLKGGRKGSRALLVDKVPSNAELRKMLSHLDIKGQGFILLWLLAE